MLFYLTVIDLSLDVFGFKESTRKTEKWKETINLLRTWIYVYIYICQRPKLCQNYAQKKKKIYAKDQNYEIQKLPFQNFYEFTETLCQHFTCICRKKCT